MAMEQRDNTKNLPREMKEVVKPFKKVNTEEKVKLKINERNLEMLVIHYFNELGIPHLKGYVYLKEALLQVIEDKKTLDKITEYIYPLVAKNNKVTYYGVERDMRYAIKVAWTRGNIKAQEEIFGCMIPANKGKPTVKKFLNIMSDYIKSRV